MYTYKYSEKKFSLYFIYLPRSPTLSDLHKFCMRVHLDDKINRAKCYLKKVSGFDFVKSQIFAFFIKKKSRR